MKILLVGNGGREHALAWSISASALTDELVIAPGSHAMAGLGECVPVAADDVEGLTALAVKIAADLVVIGPEVPLVLGLADRLADNNIAAFGPSQMAAQLEGSKTFAREICQRYHIPQPAFTVANNVKAANQQIESIGGFCVIKADGLAAGKGVFVSNTVNEAKQAAAEMLGGRFGDAGRQLLIEERIIGPEASLFALVDGTNCLFLASAQDHKRAFDKDQGPNTGGMGAISPAPHLNDALCDQVMANIVEPLARGMAEEGTPYRGVIYVGLMLTETGPKVIEFNCRLGDPEAQVILPRLKTDLVTAILAVVEGGLRHFSIRWDERSAVTVVMATKGYPGAYSKGSEIRGLAEAAGRDDTLIFHAGTTIGADDKVHANGGRVLAVTGLGVDGAGARQTAYDAIATIDWPDGFFRTDIAKS